MGFVIPKTTWQDGYAFETLPLASGAGEILPQDPHTFSYTLTQGTTYTQTIWIETDANVKDLSAVKITWFTSAGHDYRQAIVQNLGQNNYKIVSTYTWPGKTANNLRLFDIGGLGNGFDLNTGTYLKFGKLKFEKGNIATDWSPAPEDLEGTTAKAQLTADQATTTINNYKTSNDGRVASAESKITQNANAITQKVSQTDYDKKTGELTTKVNTAQSTADSATSTIGSYKQTNDARVATAESKITTNANAITQKVSQTDYNQKTGELSGNISTLKQRADGFDATVTKVNNLAIGGRNLFLNSKRLADGYGTNGNTTVTVEPFDSTTNMWHLVAAQGSGPGVGIYLYKYGDGKIPNNLDWSYSADIKGMGKASSFGIEQSDKNPVKGDITSTWSRISQTGHVGEPNAKTIIMYFDTKDSPLDVYIKLPKLETGNISTDYTPAPEDVDNKISTVSQTVDSISSIVSDPTTGLTKRVQTAEGTLSQVTGTDIPALQNATFWQPYSSLNFNDYTKQGSFFFSTTAVKTNGPVSWNNSWLYLIVEQGTSAKDRIKQTAWYDGVTGVKITYVRTLNSGTWSPWYANDNDSVTTISQTNSNVTQEISNRKTGDSNTLQSSKDFTTSSITSYDKGVQSQFTQTASAILAQVSETGVRYVRINGQGNQDNPGTHFMRLSLFDSSGNDLLLGKTATASGPNSPYLGGNNGGNGATDGNVNTYNAIYPEPNANNFMVYDLGAVTYTSQRFEVKMWTNYRTYKGVTIQVSPDNKSWRTVLQEDVRSVSGDITKPDTTINLGGTSSATQLALFKDNWSIGITDNIGKITSGIVGNASQMSLISKNVMIDSPSTQITGTAWINSAMIQKGSIVTADIADAAITSAKIATLDVAKLTGNVSSFIQSNWNGTYGSATITSSGMEVQSGSMTTLFDSSGAHFTQGTRIAQYSFGDWIDSQGTHTTSTGLGIGLTGDDNSFINIIGSSGASVALVSGSNMDYGANANIVRNAFNIFSDINIRSKLLFKGNNVVTSTYIEADEIRRTMNFYTDNAKNGDGNWFWFNHKVLSTGTFSSTSLLSKKNVIADYEEDALSEISKTDIVEFEYKNDVGEKHISPIIDDVNDKKDYYIPKTILGQDEEYVDMYSMISMAWKAIQQLNDRLEKLESR